MDKKENNTFILIIILVIILYLLIDHFFHNTISNFTDIISIILLLLLYIFTIATIIKNNLKNKINKNIKLIKHKRFITNLATISLLLLVPLLIINIFLLDKNVPNKFPFILLITLIITIIPLLILNKVYFSINKKNIKYIHEYENYILKETKEYFNNKKYNIEIIYYNNDKEINKPTKITNNYRSFIKINDKRIILVWIDTILFSNKINIFINNDNTLKHTLENLFKEL